MDDDRCIQHREQYVLELEAKISEMEQEIAALRGNPCAPSDDIEEFYRHIFENSFDGIILNLPDGTILNANPAACQIFGMTHEELCAVGRNGIVDVTDPRVMRAVEERARTGYFYTEMTLVRKDGPRFPGEVTSKLFRDRSGRILSSLIVRDITGRKKADELFYKAFHENQTMMAITKIEDGVYIDVNDSYAASAGYTREEMIGRSTLELGVWADLSDREAMHEHLSKYHYFKNREIKFRTATGEKASAILSGNLIDLNNERCLITSLVNITERKKAEEALKQSEELLFKIFNSIPLPIIIFEEDGTIVEVNETMLVLNNVKREDIVGRNSLNMSLWQSPDTFFEYKNCLRENGKVTNFETTIKRATGQTVTALISGVSLKWKGKNCILSISNDITELRKYQQEISRLDNLNIIGQMAASIAHEVRNPMTSIKGFLQLFHSQYRYKEDADLMEVMIEELDRVNEIITSFLSLAQKNTLDLRLHMLNVSIKSLLPLITADAIKSDIVIDTNLGNLPKILIDESEIKQLLLNLTRNAIQAMPSGGKLTIETFEDFSGVNLVVKDEGDGIPPEILDRIGTPFLTTKENGTGLGMAVCFSIAERHKANITFESSPEGTTFKATFPVA